MSSYHEEHIEIPNEGTKRFHEVSSSDQSTHETRWGHFAEQLRSAIETNIERQQARLRITLEEIESWTREAQPTFHGEVARVCLEILREASPIMRETLDDIGLDTFFFQRLAGSRHYVDVCTALMVINQAAKFFYASQTDYYSSVDPTLDESIDSDDRRDREYFKQCAAMESALYRLKDRALRMALCLADIQAPQWSWGYLQPKQKEEYPVLYFDLPGIGQVSFHAPSFQPDEIVGRRSKDASEIRVPVYAGEWESARDDYSIEQHTLDTAWDLYVKKYHPISFGQLFEQLVDWDEKHTENEYHPRRILHDLFVQFMGHPDFQDETLKHAALERLAELTSTVPGTMSMHFVEQGYLPEPVPLEYKAREEPWRMEIEPTFEGILSYLSELEVFLDEQMFSQDEVSQKVHEVLIPALDEFRRSYVRQEDESRFIARSSKQLAKLLNVTMREELQNMADGIFFES